MTIEIAPDDLRAILAYDPDTGLFVWKVRPQRFFHGPRAEVEYRRWNRRYTGTPALCTPAKKGYLAGQIFGQAVFAHRVAWAHFYGAWPVNQIDHRNMVPADNRIRNLREATQSQNLMNRLPLRGSTKFCGITQLPSGNWSASITAERKRRHIGVFDSPEGAARAYDAFAIRLHGEFARTNFPITEGTVSQ